MYGRKGNFVKKSTIEVSMPLLTYEELIDYKQKYEELRKQIESCFDCTLVSHGGSVMLRLKELVQVAKDCRMKTFSVENIEILNNL